MTRRRPGAHARGRLRGAELVAWLAEHPPAERDARDRGAPRASRRPPRREAPLGAERMAVHAQRDRAHRARGARRARHPGRRVRRPRLRARQGGDGRAPARPERAARGVELSAGARGSARGPRRSTWARPGDVRRGTPSKPTSTDATVVFLYLPFTGEVLAGVMRRLQAVARQRQIVVCTLGLDLRGHRLARRAPAPRSSGCRSTTAASPARRRARPRAQPRRSGRRAMRSRASGESRRSRR